MTANSYFYKRPDGSLLELVEKRVSDEDVRILFDLVINSLDFGSGFLYDEDIEALRRVADVLGIDRKANHL